VESSRHRVGDGGIDGRRVGEAVCGGDAQEVQPLQVQLLDGAGLFRQPGDVFGL
jgi:hypothetical protein